MASVRPLCLGMAMWAIRAWVWQLQCRGSAAVPGPWSVLGGRVRGR